MPREGTSFAALARLARKRADEQRSLREDPSISLTAPGAAGAAAAAPAPTRAPKDSDDDLDRGLSSLFLGIDDDDEEEEEERVPTVYELDFEARGIIGNHGEPGSFVNGVWTPGWRDRRTAEDVTEILAATVRTVQLRTQPKERLSASATRDIYRNAMSRPAPQTPSKSARSVNISPLGVDEFDPDDHIPDDACAVCLSSLSTGAVTLPCGHRFHESCVRGVYAYQQACPMCRDDTPLQLTPRRRTDEDVYNWRSLEDWEPHHFAIVGACTKCGETIYYGQHTRISVTRQQYHTYSCPTPEMNAILRALAAEYEDSEIYTGRDSHWGYQRDPDWGIN